MTDWMLLTGMLSSSPITRMGENYLRSFESIESLFLSGRGLLPAGERHPFTLPISISEEGTEVRNSKPVQRLKILMLTWEFPPNIVGGLARHTYGLSSSLAESDCEVHVITALQIGLPAYEMAHGVHIHRVKPLNEADDDFIFWIAGLNLAMANKAKQLSGENQFDMIHAHDWLVAGAGIVLKDYLSIPLLTTIHATEYGRNNGIHTELQRFIHEKERQLIEKSNQLIVCSNYMKDELLSVFGVPEHRLAVIPNGIEWLQPIHNGTEFPMPFFPQKKMVFSVGRIVKEKGFETIIEAAIVAREKNLGIYFVIAGKGPMLETYRHKIKEHQLEDYLFFPGFIQDEQRDEFFSLCDIAVFPSLYEPFGIVALEAMIHGKPTIVSETGGLKGIIKHLQTGLLMEPGNANQLLDHVIFLLENKAEADRMAERGKGIVESLYSWKRIARDTKRLMDDVILLNKVGKKNL
jgi:glycosyltransferase involved in cell wall biosynthesis